MKTEKTSSICLPKIGWDGKIIIGLKYLMGIVFKAAVLNIDGVSD